MSWDAQQPHSEPEQQPTAPYPQYPQDAYGQPVQQTQPVAYGQPGQYDQPPPQSDQHGGYGGPYFPAYAPPKRRRTGFYVALGVVAVLVATGVAVGVAASGSNSGNGAPTAALGSSSSAAASDTPSAVTSATASAGLAPQTQHTLIIPQSAGPLNLLVDADTARRTANIKSTFPANNALSKAQIGFYTIGTDSSFSVWMLGESTADVPAFRTTFNTLGATGMARAIARQVNMTNTTSEDAGSLGGAVICGRVLANSVESRVCAWVDESTFAWVYFTPSVRAADMPIYTLDLRSAAEQ